MLIGDPDRFAIWFDPVESWSSERFKNGSFSYFVGGNLIWSTNSTIGDDFGLLEASHCMNESTEDAKLFNSPVTEAYQELCAQAYPSMDSNAEKNDFTHIASPPSLSDEGNCIFLVEYNEKAKLICGMGADLSSVFEVYLERGEFQLVVSKAILSFRQHNSSLQ